MAPNATDTIHNKIIKEALLKGAARSNEINIPPVRLGVLGRQGEEGTHNIGQKKSHLIPNNDNDNFGVQLEIAIWLRFYEREMQESDEHFRAKKGSLSNMLFT